VLVKAFVLLAPAIGVLAFAYTAVMARITETPPSGNPLPGPNVSCRSMDHDQRQQDEDKLKRRWAENIHTPCNKRH
jgi:hypothetical protein